MGLREIFSQCGIRCSWSFAFKSFTASVVLRGEFASFASRNTLLVLIDLLSEDIIEKAKDNLDAESTGNISRRRTRSRRAKEKKNLFFSLRYLSEDIRIRNRELDLLLHETGRNTSRADRFFQRIGLEPQRSELGREANR